MVTWYVNIFCKFRIGCHKLEIEIGRHKNIPINERICKLCNDHIEDEVHFLLQCPYLKKFRDPFLFYIFDNYPNLVQCNDTGLFIWLMSCEDKLVITKISNLLEILFKQRTEGLNV